MIEEGIWLQLDECHMKGRFQRYCPEAGSYQGMDDGGDIEAFSQGNGKGQRALKQEITKTKLILRPTKKETFGYFQKAKNDTE